MCALSQHSFCISVYTKSFRYIWDFIYGDGLLVKIFSDTTFLSLLWLNWLKLESRSCQANFTPRKVKNTQLFAKSFFPTLFASFKCLCSFVWGKAAATVITNGKQISKWGMMHDAHLFTVVCFVFTLIHYCTLNAHFIYMRLRAHSLQGATFTQRVWNKCRFSVANCSKKNAIEHFVENALL